MNYRKIKTKSGMLAIVVNNMVIRLSEDKKRLKEDGESFEEYKVRQRLVPKLLKSFRIREVSNNK